MESRRLTVTFDARDAGRVARFWGEMLGREVVEDAGGALVPGDDTQVGLRFVASDLPQVGPASLHLHVTSDSLTDQERKVASALSLGGAHLDVGQLPEEGHIVLADPEGNAFCVIEPGNKFLAGCGLLGEVACDGGREVGVFWSAATGWPLVWDQDDETAIQSPHGGTKVAWGGASDEPRLAPDRQRLELTLPGSDVDRLIALGATRLEDGTGRLADPGGNEFSVRGN